MEYVGCDYCGSAESTVVARQTDLLHKTTDEVFSIVRCQGCGLQYTNPRPGPDEIGRYYASDYAFHAPLSSWRRWIDRALDAWANSPFAIVAAALPPVARRLVARVRPTVADPVLEYYRSGGEGTFLDIGCGSGWHAHYWGGQSSLLACRGLADVAGVEISDAARASLAKSGVRCWPNLAAVPDSERFGLIRMNWSLEHVHSPSAYFAFIAAHLKPGGRAVIAVPNYDGLIYRLAPDCVELPVHLYHFRPQDVLAYGKRHGLCKISVTTFSYPEMFRVAAEVGLLPVVLASRSGIVAAREMLRTLVPFDQAGWGNDMVVILEKSLPAGAMSGSA
ncbi:MAG: class I SAM-dependent methyltransferase [Nitrospira sp.]